MSATKKRSGVELARQRDLAGHERVIENARQSFVDWGRALGKIRNGKLYEVDGYADFDEYVIERWEMRPQHAYRLITAARVALILSPMGYKITSERAARELAPIAEDAEMLRAVYEEADRRAAGGRVTAALIAASRESLAPQVIDGDWTDDDEPELNGVVEAMRGAIEEIEHKQTSPGTADPEDGAEGAADFSGSAVPSDTPTTSGPAATSPAGGSGENQPATAALVEAEGFASPSAADAATSANQTGEDSAPVESPVDEPEQPAAGASPAAPDSDEDDDEKRLLDWRRGVSRDLMQALVDVHMRLQPSPAAWLEKFYLPDSYPDRNMPRVRDCFTPENIRISAQYLLEVAEWLEKNGVEL